LLDKYTQEIDRFIDRERERGRERERERERERSSREGVLRKPTK